MITACSNRNTISAIICSDTSPFTALYKTTKAIAWKTLDLSTTRGSSYPGPHLDGFLNGGQRFVDFTVLLCLTLENK